MKNRVWVFLTLLPVCNVMLAQSLAPNGNRQLQLSLQNGFSSLLTSSSIDSVYFAKAGFQTGIEGNYYWNNFGLSGSMGYFTNAADRQALEDFARSRKAPLDRAQLMTASHKGLYFFTGPAFQSSFNKWRLQSSLEGGVISKPATQVLIGDNAARDVVYYRNVFDESSSFAWSAGLSLSYAVSSQVLLGINADYVNTKNEVVNYDILRGGGREAKNITSQTGMLNTGIRLSYLLNSKSREAGSGIATGKRSATIDDNGTVSNAGKNTANGSIDNTSSSAGKSYMTPGSHHTKTTDTCRCQDKVMEVYEMEPYVVEIQFGTVQEARVFLDTYEPMLARRESQSGLATGKRQHSAISNPLYQEAGSKGSNPLYEKSSRTISNAQGSRGIVHVNAQGQQSFYVLPTAVDLSAVLSLKDGRVTVHVTSGENAPGTREAGSGMATGRRTYKAIAVGDLDGDGINDLMLRSNGNVNPPRDVSSGQSAGRISKIDAFTIKQGIVIEADLDGDGEFEPLQNVKSPRDLPAGQASGKRMAKEDVYVWKIKFTGDLDGDGVPDGFVCSGINKNAELFAGRASFSINISEEEEDAPNTKVVEKATSGVKQTMQTQVFVTNNDPDPPPMQKAGISTSRSNIRTKSIMSCGDGSCVMMCEIEIDGQVYNALITSRARHDTVKNAIGNIR